MINLSLNAVITIMMIFHLPKHSPVSLAWLVFSAVFLRLSLQYLCQIKPVRNTRNTKPRPMTIVINIGDFRSLNMFLTSSPCCFCFAEFCRIKQKIRIVRLVPGIMRTQRGGGWGERCAYVDTPFSFWPNRKWLICVDGGFRMGQYFWSVTSSKAF